MSHYGRLQTSLLRSKHCWRSLVTKTMWMLFVVQELSGQRMNWQNPASSKTSVWRLEIMLAPSPFPHTMAGLMSCTCSLCGCLADRRSHDGARADVPEHLDTGAVVRGANPSLRLGIQNETTQLPLGLGGTVPGAHVCPGRSRGEETPDLLAPEMCNLPVLPRACDVVFSIPAWGFSCPLN